MKAGWQVKKIGDVCSLMTGGTPSKSKLEYFGGEIRWLVSGDIHQEEIFDCEGRITEAGMKNSNAKLLPVNSVMIALNGQGKTRGTVALLRTPATCNQSLVSIYPNEPEKLLSEYLYANLHGRYQEIRQMTGDSGNDRRGLNMALLKNIEIPIASLPEQRRIVAILDEAFDGIAVAKANAEKNLQNARALFESHLQAVFSHRGESWIVERLADITEVKDGTHDSPKYVSAGIPFVTQKNIRNEGLSFENTKFISQVDHEKFYKRSNVALGDILISMIGANRGMACVVDDARIFSIKNVGLVKQKSSFDQQFLLFYLKSNQAANYVKAGSKGGAQEFIGLTELRNFPIPFPSLNRQKSLATELTLLEVETQRLESIYQRKLAALDELKKSLLHQAFSGEL